MVHWTAKRRAHLAWRSTGAQEEKEAYSIFLQRARRRLGVQGVAQHAWMKRRMLQHVNASPAARKAAKARYNKTKQRLRDWSTEYYNFIRPDSGWRPRAWTGEY